MRENMGLFRGKRIVDGHWIEGSLWLCIGMPKILSAGNIVGYDVAAETVGECTGAKDKNGKLIFEGDICLVKSPRGTYSYTMRVAWDSSFFNGWVESMYATDEESTRHCEQAQFEHFTDYQAKCCEVIGNAYDNPELLEESNEY